MRLHVISSVCRAPGAGGGRGAPRGSTASKPTLHHTVPSENGFANEKSNGVTAPASVAAPSTTKVAPVGEKRRYWRAFGERYS